MRAGVQEQLKTLFSLQKYKPEIVFDDALNNDIESRETPTSVSYMIGQSAKWPSLGELVEWFAAKYDVVDNRKPFTQKTL